MNKTLLIAFVALAALLAGCVGLPAGSSVDTNYYRLSLVEQASVTDHMELQNKSVLVRVNLPKMLDTPRMAYVEGEHTIAYKEGARWAQSLDREISRVVAQGLRKYFSVAKPLPIRVGQNVDYRLDIDVQEAWATSTGEVRLVADWSCSEDGEVIAAGRESVVQTGWSAGDFENMAAKMSRASSTMAKNIGESLYSLDAEQK